MFLQSLPKFCTGRPFRCVSLVPDLSLMRGKSILPSPKPHIYCCTKPTSGDKTIAALNWIYIYIYICEICAHKEGLLPRFSSAPLQRQAGDILEELVSVFLSYREQGLVEDPTYVTHGNSWIADAHRLYMSRYKLGLIRTLIRLYILKCQ